jgi:hypothetical protein
LFLLRMTRVVIRTKLTSRSARSHRRTGTGDGVSK